MPPELKIADKPDSADAPIRPIRGDQREAVDTSGITVKGKIADITRLVLQAGFAVVAFSAVIGGGIWGAMAIRSDYKARDSETRADHKEEVAKLLATFSEQQKQSREDARERDQRHNEGQEKMWRRIGEVVEGQKEATAVLQAAAKDLKACTAEISKVGAKLP